MSAPRVLVHTSHQAIRWGDMDAHAHVNNTVYFRYMEQARVEWLHAVGTLGAESDPATGAVVVNASCTFLVPLVYPAAIEVRMYAGARGRSSVGTTYEILCAGRVVAEGAAKMVWIDVAGGHSTPLPQGVIASLRTAGLP